MALIKDGYWQDTYWPSRYWQEDYWPEYGVVVPPAAPEIMIPSGKASLAKLVIPLMLGIKISDLDENLKWFLPIQLKKENNVRN